MRAGQPTGSPDTAIFRLAAILERPVLEKILEHLGLEPQPPPRMPAREPGRRQPG